MSTYRRFAQLLPAALLLAGAGGLTAQSNLLINGDFSQRFLVQTVQTQTCEALPSSALDWTASIQGTCGVPSGLELETDLLLGVTAPFLGPTVHMVHIRVEPLVSNSAGDPANSGIYQAFGGTGEPTRVLTSVWVYVVNGQAGVGASRGSAFTPGATSTVLGVWQQLISVSSASGPNRFNINSTSPTGAEFYATNAIVCPADTDTDLAACQAFVGSGSGGGGGGPLAGLTITPPSVTGGTGATGTLTLTSPAPVDGLTVMVSSSDPAAGVPTSVMVPGGMTSTTFPITTTPVQTTTTATITATSGTDSVSAGLTINPASGPNTGTIIGLNINPPSVTGGQGATGTVTLSAPAPAGGVPVSLSSNNPAAGTPTSVTVPAGQNSATFPVTTTPVQSTTMATITATSANTMSAGLTINPAGSSGGNTGTIIAIRIIPSTVTGGQGANGTVVLSANAPAGGVVVSLASNNGSATTPSSVTVPAGSDAATFPVSTTPVSSTTVATITATSANSASASLTINPATPPPCVGSITIPVQSLIGGNSIQGLVTLTANAGVGGEIVNLSSSSAALSVPATVTVQPGQNQVSFNITTLPVLSVISPFISANVAACATVTGSVRLFP